MTFRLSPVFFLLAMAGTCIPCAGLADQPELLKRGSGLVAKRKLDPPKEAKQPSAAAELLREKYDAGEYAEVAEEGPALLAREKWNNELRFNVANSLAWTGRTSEAMAQYEMLEGTEYEQRATLGLANIDRWDGRPHRAAAAYRKVLQTDPDNPEAKEGLLLAERELRPRTAAQVVRARNSNDVFRTATVLSHRWRDATGARVFEVAAGRADENDSELRLVQRDLSFRYENLDGWLAPQLEVSAQQSPGNRVFAAAAIKFPDAPVYLSAGHINWGKLAFDPRALRDGLTANQLGGKLDVGGRLGDLGIGYNAYWVSDDNLVHAGQIRFVPARQPFSTSLKVFVGVEARKARFDDPRYWSPAEGYYAAFAGVSGDWTEVKWQSYGSLQYGVQLRNESGSTWSAGGGTKRWLGEDWALGADFWAMDTPRDGGYRASSAMLRLEKLW
jgi:tetratricopeptide (TPR) repeat protein